MNKKNLQILGLEEGATKEQINAAYDALRAKYLEERFADDEVGNNAAVMLTKIEQAHSELLNEIAESSQEGQESVGSAFEKVEELIKAGDLAEAQRALDSFNERGARWHYLQSVLFYKKNWINESKKQLEIALQLEPNNEKYKTAYKKLCDKINYQAHNAHRAQNEQNQSVYEGQTMNSAPDDQMGGGMCQYCIECCAINACINCLCNGCC